MFSLDKDRNTYKMIIAMMEVSTGWIRANIEAG